MSASVTRVAMATLRKNDPEMGVRCTRCRHERVLHVKAAEGRAYCWTQEDDGWWCECPGYLPPDTPDADQLQ